MDTEAPLLETFSSIQGEGLHMGEPQVFVRLAGCPLRCRWCDTPESWPSSGSRRESPLAVAARIADLDPDGDRAVSVTGGEPLLWPAFVQGLAGLIQPRALHLETSGVFPDVLAGLLHVVTHISLDLKPPGDMLKPVPMDAWHPDLPHDEDSWAVTRRACLALVAGRDACAKLVLADTCPVEQQQPLIQDLVELAPDVPLILQPVTPRGGVAAPAAGQVDRLAQFALDQGLNVRVLPQIHPLLGVR